jgi:hypothetical protein
MLWFVAVGLKPLVIVTVAADGVELLIVTLPSGSGGNVWLLFQTLLPRDVQLGSKYEPSKTGLAPVP